MTIAEMAGQAAGLLGDDALMIGARIYNNADGTPKPKQPKVASVFRTRHATSTFIKQEPDPVTTPTKEETRAAMDANLRKFVDDAVSPEDKAEVLIKIRTYSQEYEDQQPLLKNVDAALVEQVMNEWFARGHAELKKAIINARTGELTQPLAKIAATPAPEEFLAKMLDNAPNDDARSHLLSKIGSLARQVVVGLETMEKEPAENHPAMFKAWIEADPPDAELRKNILNAEMDRRGKALYGEGVETGKVVAQVVGNASTHASTKLGGSQGDSPGIAATVPKPSSSEGAGARFSNAVMPTGSGGAESPNPGSGPTDTGEAGITPTTLIRRRGATGGLGNSVGAQGNGSRVTDAMVTGKRKKKGETDAEKAELIADLVKLAPDEMIEMLGELTPEEQAETCAIAGDHAADLIAWSGMIDPDTLQKSAMDAEVAAWLAEDPNTVALKKWTAEALATGEAIPIELANSILAWEPKVTVRVRQPLATAA
jgi:hypothetical protein